MEMELFQEVNQLLIGKKKIKFLNFLLKNHFLKQSYCGFQFGHFAGQLGDGRAMYLGEVIFFILIFDILKCF